MDSADMLSGLAVIRDDMATPLYERELAAAFIAVFSQMNMPKGSLLQVLPQLMTHALQALRTSQDSRIQEAHARFAAQAKCDVPDFDSLIPSRDQVYWVSMITGHIVHRLTNQGLVQARVDAALYAARNLAENYAGQFCFSAVGAEVLSAEGQYRYGCFGSVALALRRSDQVTRLSLVTQNGLVEFTHGLISPYPNRAIYPQTGLYLQGAQGTIAPADVEQWFAEVTTHWNAALFEEQPLPAS